MSCERTTHDGGKELPRGSLANTKPGMSDFDTNWARLAPNGTDKTFYGHISMHLDHCVSS